MSQHPAQATARADSILGWQKKDLWAYGNYFARYSLHTLEALTRNSMTSW